MRTVAALVLLCLALAVVSARVCTPDAEACAAADVLAVQTPTDDGVDEVPWDLPRLAPAVDACVSPVPEATAARHVPRLEDQRRTRPPRA